jgi:Xaa-Pro aminopeptidase
LQTPRRPLATGPDFVRAVSGRLVAGLGELDAQALVVLAKSSRDPDLGAFIGPVKLGGGVLVVPRPRGGEPLRPRLGFLTPMERDEAAASGLDLLSPADLDVERWARQTPDAGVFLANVVSRALQLTAVMPGRLALAGSHAAGTVVAASEELRRDGWQLTSGSELVRRLRRQKTSGQLLEAGRAARGVVTAFFRAAELLAATTDHEGELWLAGERLTVRRLRDEIAVELARAGLEQPEGNIVAPAEEGAVPHSRGTDERVLRNGQSLVVDLYPRGFLFADCTRTFCVGRAPEGLVRAHAAALAALRLARQRATVGASGWELQVAVCEALAAHGYATPVTHPGTLSGYVHGLGHGVGTELHELPSFGRTAAGDDGRLAAGDVFTLEPGIYEPEAGYAVRLEDLVALDEGGALVDLTPLPYDLDPRSWTV